MAEDFDMNAHRDTWRTFIRLSNYGVVFVAVLLVLMAIFLI